MARRNLSAVIRYLRQLSGSAGASGAGDAELLERYVRHRDEAAFELLLWRHGTLVFNVCRRLLPREQDAEDAFQATFLAFVRKAGSISRRGSVSSWLYKVAYRVALEARERARKTAEKEQRGGEMLAVQRAADPTWSDVRPILDEEVNRLPERLRRPFVLCYLEGKSNEEAARELGCRLGTIYSRLARGREMLRRRLRNRGVTLSLAGLTAVLTARGVEAAPAGLLLRSTMRAALSFAESSAAAVSPRVATLAEGVLRAMFVTKLKIAAVMLFVAAVLTAGGVLSHGLTAAPQAEVKAEKPNPKGEDKKDAESIPVKVVKPKKGGMFLMMPLDAEAVASQQQQIVPLVSGTVKEVQVDIGDRVKKGQTLIVLDAPLLAKEGEQAAYSLKMAQAEEQEAQARLVMAEAEVQAAKALHKMKLGEIAVVTAGITKWQAEVKRLEREVQRGVVDGRVLLESQNQLALVKAKCEAAEAAALAAEADIRNKDGKLSHAKAALAAARAAAGGARTVTEKASIQESFTQLTAAFDGVVTRRTIDPGNFVQPSDSRLLRPLLTVQRIDTMRMVVQVPAQKAPHIKRRMPAKVDMPGFRGRDYKISRFSPSLEANSLMTVEVDVPNVQNRLLPGMRGIIKLPLYETPPGTLIVPSTCLVRPVLDSQPEAWVYFVRDGKAYKKAVQVNFNDGQNAAITKDIQTSDLVITNPAKLENGTPVKIEQEP